MKLLFHLLGCACAAAVLFAQSAPQGSRVSRPLVVRTIRYQNLQTVSIHDILQRFKEKGAKLAVEKAYDPQDVKQAAELLKDLLAERGHPNAEIKTTTGPIPPHSIEITFRVVEQKK